MSKRLWKKYGKLPPKDVDLRPWHKVCMDCIEPLTIKVRDSNNKITKRAGFDQRLWNKV